MKEPILTILLWLKIRLINKKPLPWHRFLFSKILKMLLNSCSARHFDKRLPYTFVLLKTILICRYREFMLSNNVILFRKFLVNFSAITRVKSWLLNVNWISTTKIKKKKKKKERKKKIGINVYQWDVSQDCFFEFLKPRAFKMSTKILSGEIFETLN